jgi:hypothetical protein
VEIALRADDRDKVVGHGSFLRKNYMQVVNRGWIGILRTL